MDKEQEFIRFVQYSHRCVIALSFVSVFTGAYISMLHFNKHLPATGVETSQLADDRNIPIAQIRHLENWNVPDSLAIPNTEEGNSIRYGRELVAHTSLYLGPAGTVARITNGMNCQHCHLKAGKKIFGNNYSAVSSTYPKFRARSGTIETIEKRVNDCIERSLNGKPLNPESKELKAFVAYISWVGKNVENGTIPHGAGLWDLPLLQRAASPEQGKKVFLEHCVLCHGQDGQGVKKENDLEWNYPPLWGPLSYNTGAGLFRLSRFAGFVKANMPNGASFDNPTLTDEEAWDVAAYVNSMPRPHKIFADDWPDISSKPFDHPFGPYGDNFSEDQHKFGPFQAMKRQRSNAGK